MNKEGADSKTKVHLDRILGCQCDGAYKKATFLVVDNPQDSQEFISYKDPIPTNQKVRVISALKPRSRVKLCIILFKSKETVSFYYH